MEAGASSSMLVIAYQGAQYPSEDHSVNSPYYKILVFWYVNSVEPAGSYTSNVVYFNCDFIYFLLGWNQNKIWNLFH
jgi:hypothetical protein